jgi:serine/threonine-protein kinase
VFCPKCGARTFFEAESESGVDPLLGKVLDQRYRIEARVGRGGMGTVYKAVQIAMSRVVAVKVMNPELARNTEAVKRFHREAKAATAFDHPHGIRLIDFGQAATRELFMVMEFLDGRSLSKVLKDEAPFTAARAAKVAGEIAKALAAAHRVGLVHRDMKPDNVFLLDAEGDADFVKVLDFGIAKFVEGTGDSTMTRTGLIVGTPHFMAPEQAQPGSKLTPAVDVYALGVMLYAMLAGRHPYKADTPLDALMAHVNEPVPTLPPGLTLPDELRSLVPRMLAKAPGERPSAAEVAAILERVRLLEMAAALGAHVAPQADPAPADTTLSDLPSTASHTPREESVPVRPAPRTSYESYSAEYGYTDYAKLRPRRTWLWLVLAGVAVLAIAGVVRMRATTGSAPSAVASDPNTPPAGEAASAVGAPRVDAAPASLIKAPTVAAPDPKVPGEPSNFTLEPPVEDPAVKPVQKAWEKARLRGSKLAPSKQKRSTKASSEPAPAKKIEEVR